jgi:hypothetical protein
MSHPAELYNLDLAEASTGQGLCSVVRVMAGAGGLFGGVRTGGLNH